jgi:hypothetical protein
MVDSSSVHPARPVPHSAERPSRRVSTEDEVVSAWLDVLVMDGLLPGWPVPAHPL